MKKEYIKPMLEVFRFERPTHIIGTSGEGIIYQNGVFYDEDKIG